MKHDLHPFFIPNEIKEWFMKIEPQCKKVNQTKKEKIREEDGILVYNKDMKRASAQQIVANYAYDFDCLYDSEWRRLYRIRDGELLGASAIVDHLTAMGIHFRKLPLIAKEIEELLLSPEWICHLVRFKKN